MHSITAQVRSKANEIFSRPGARPENWLEEMGERVEQLWAENVDHDPDQVAVIDAASGLVTTRRELSEGARHWRETRGTRMRRGDRIVLAAPNSRQWIEAFLGLLEIGVVPAALDPGEPESSQLAVAASIGARWLSNLDELRELPGGRHRRHPDDCLIKVTSGSTGRPRALRFSHAQMLADGRQVCRTMEIRPEDRNLAVIPLGHSYGLGNLVIPLLAQGTSLIIGRGPLPHAIAEDVVRHVATVFPSVPVVLRALVRAELEPGALQSLRTVISAGSVLEAELARAFHARFGTRVHGFYGSSETGGICYDRSGEASLTGRGVGTPLEGVGIVPRSRDRFWVESPAVMNPGRFSPADRGRLNEQGELVLLGRAGRTIKLAGRRLELGEVEAALKRLPGVVEAFAMAHPQKPEALAAAVVSEKPADELRRLLGHALAPWKIPDHLLVLPDFPTTARGKVDQARLRALLGARG